MNARSSRSILVVSNDSEFTRQVAALVGNRYQLQAVPLQRDAMMEGARHRPDLVLLDLDPGCELGDTCLCFKQGKAASSPVIVVAHSPSGADHMRALNAGADDYLSRPLDEKLLLSRIRLHLRLQDTMATFRAGDDEEVSYDSEVERLVATRTRHIISSSHFSAFTLAMLADFQDVEMGGRLTRTRYYSIILAEQLKRSSPYSSEINLAFLENLYRACPLHEIGCIGLERAPAFEESSADEGTEWIQQHTIIGAVFLEQAAALSPANKYLGMASLIARWHHEHFDGSGYPAGLAGNEIPLPARIVSLADFYDSITSDNATCCHDTVREAVQRESGRLFDPAIVEAFHSRYDDLVKVQQELNHGCPVVQGAANLLE